MKGLIVSNHAILSPSSAPRWLHCPGSVALHAQFTDSGSADAAEGTAAHTLAEKCLVSSTNADEHIGMVIPTDYAPFKVDDDMADAVQRYVDYVRQVVAGCNGELRIEQRLSIEHLTGEQGAHGTSDAVILSSSAPACSSVRR